MVPFEDNSGNTPHTTTSADPLHSRIRRAHQRATSLFSEALAPHGLTPPQWAALAALHQQGPMSQIDLGRAIAMDPATMQGVVVRLIARSLVTRASDTHDRRRNVVRLSTAGQDLVAEASPAVARAEADFDGRLSPQERDTLVALLGKLIG